MNPDVTATATPTKRGRGRPRKVSLGDERVEWLKPASAARLLDLPRSTMSDMMHGRAQVREPLVIRHLPNGQARVSRASVPAQLAGIVLALAVEQSGDAIVSPALPRHPGMGLGSGKVLASGARLGGLAGIGGEWDHFAGSVGDMPTGRESSYVGRDDDRCISPGISPVDCPIAPGFQQGGRGSDRGAGGDGAMGFKEQKISALAEGG